MAGQLVPVRDARDPTALPLLVMVMGSTLGSGTPIRATLQRSPVIIPGAGVWRSSYCTL